MERSLLSIAIAFLNLVILSQRVETAQAPEPTLQAVLARTAVYVQQLHAQLASIVSEETYVQEVRTTLDSSMRPFSTPRRTLVSDLLLVRPAREDRYVEYRDVFEVDGVAVRDRKERLTALFLTPGEIARRRIGAIIDESARYNIGDIPRNINTPMLTLSFLLPQTQPQFRFRALRREEPRLSAPGAGEGDSTVFRVSTEMWTIGFKETRRPTVIRSNNGRDFPAAGRFWVNPDTGAVLMSELEMDNRMVHATINVSYLSEPMLGFLVPVEMREHYESRGVFIDGRATYGRFRQFEVTTQESIGKPPGLDRR